MGRGEFNTEISLRDEKGEKAATLKMFVVLINTRFDYSRSRHKACDCDRTFKRSMHKFFPYSLK